MCERRLAPPDEVHIWTRVHTAHQAAHQAHVQHIVWQHARKSTCVPHPALDPALDRPACHALQSSGRSIHILSTNTNHSIAYGAVLWSTLHEALPMQTETIGPSD